MHPRSKTIPMAPIHLFTKQMVATFIACRIICLKPFHLFFIYTYLIIKHFLPSITFYECIHSFSFVVFLSFLLYTFSWTCGNFCEPQKYFFVLSLLCQITHIKQPQSVRLIRNSNVKEQWL